MALATPLFGTCMLLSALLMFIVCIATGLLEGGSTRTNEYGCPTSKKMVLALIVESRGNVEGKDTALLMKRDALDAERNELGVELAEMHTLSTAIMGQYC